MVKDDSLYIIAIVAVVAVVGLVIMATGSSSTVMVAEDLPSMVEDDSSAIAGEAFRTMSERKSIKSDMISAGLNDLGSDVSPHDTCMMDCQESLEGDYDEIYDYCKEQCKWLIMEHEKTLPHVFE